MNNTPISIIILNWNGSDDTVECINSLLNNNYTNYQLILVDNGSEEKDFEFLKSWCDKRFKIVKTYTQTEAQQGGNPEIEKIITETKSNEKILIIKNNENLGFAAGNNVALNYILSKKEQDNYTLLLNNDTVVEPDFLSNLVGFIDKNPSFSACTPQIRLYKPNDEIWNCGGKITWFGNRRYYYAGKKVADTPQHGYNKIEFITGCAMLFKPQITGILSEKFFFGEEDFEFSLRLKKRKMKIACVYDSIIFHKVGRSINTSTKNKLINKVFLFYTSRLINHKSYYKSPTLEILRIINLTYGILLVALKYKYGIIKGIKLALMAYNFTKLNNDIKKEKFSKIMEMKF